MEELTPAEAVEQAWRSHREIAIFDLIFALLEVVYQLLIRCAFTPSAATLLTPAVVHRTAAPPTERSPEQLEHQQQEDMEPPVPRRVHRRSSPGSFSPLARLVLQRKMLECWANTPKNMQEYRASSIRRVR